MSTPGSGPSSLSSVVSTLVRASMGTAVPTQVTDEDLDRHVAALILKEAKQKAERYGTEGYRAYSNHNTPSDANVPRTNKRYLSTVIRRTEDHNQSVLKAQAVAAAQVKQEREAKERAERRRRAEEAVGAAKMRRGDIERRANRRGDWRGGDDGRRLRAWEVKEEEEAEEESEYRRERRKRRDRSRSPNEGSSTAKDDWDEEGSGSHRHHRHHSRHHHHHRSSRRERDRSTRRSSRKSRSRSSAPKRSTRRDVSADADKAKEDKEIKSRPRRSLSPSTREATPPLPRSRSHTETREVESSHKRKRSPPRSRSRSPPPTTKHPKPRSRSRSPTPHRPSLSPMSLSPSPSPKHTPTTHSTKMDKYFSSTYDPRLDVSAPEVPATGLLDSAQFEGWEAMLEVLRMRREDKEEKRWVEKYTGTSGGKDKDGKERKSKKRKLEGEERKVGREGAAGRWGGEKEVESVMSIEYKKRGSVREWDVGKDLST